MAFATVPYVKGVHQHNCVIPECVFVLIAGSRRPHQRQGGLMKSNGNDCLQIWIQIADEKNKTLVGKALLRFDEYDLRDDAVVSSFLINIARFYPRPTQCPYI